MTNRLPVVGDVVRWKNWATTDHWPEEGNVVVRVEPWDEPFSKSACRVYFADSEWQGDSYGWTWLNSGHNNFEIIKPALPKPQVGDVLLWKWDQRSFVGEQTITRILDNGRVVLSPGHKFAPEENWYHDPENTSNNWTVVSTADTKEQERISNLRELQDKLHDLNILVAEIQELRLKL